MAIKSSPKISINTKKWENIMQLVVLFLGLILINIIAQNYFFRLDLTAEKRYTITESSKTILKNLEEPVYIEIYLEGELNSSFKRLQKSVKETLQEFSMYGGKNIQFTFINPEQISNNPEEQNRYYKQLSDRGIQPTTVFETVQGKKVQKLIFPSAIVSYKNKEKPVLLLKGNRTASPQEQLNQSIENIEYELISAIQKLSKKQKSSVAFIEGHDELSNDRLISLTQSLSENYIVERLNLNENLTTSFQSNNKNPVQNLSQYDAIVVAKPTLSYTDNDRYQLDQYLMNGGKLLFFIDQIQMNLDSIAQGGTYAFAYNLGLNEMIFRYGVRVNQNLLQDTQSGQILVNVGQMGNNANIQAIPFPYYATTASFSTHPITKNMDALMFKFASTLDSVKADGITQTPLVFSSQYSKIKKIPTLISLDELKLDLNPKLYQTSNLPVAYLLEGEFSSAFKGRFPPSGFSETDFIQKGKDSKVLVVGDGDLLSNDFDRKTRQPLPIGYDEVSKNTYSNQEFLLNTLAYMLDEGGIITSRTKEFEIRPLDTFKIQEEKSYWQFLNLVVPNLIILFFGLAWYFWRKKKYS
ncbi:gliding-associated putative ABC transporter substrate-binding component GldG [Bernardetia litoralis DSM 6794]|uniref:Gliding-associated putative ABC transporter substrate-binding component GldG n=1 Tax=Bernardetia litoralis (strain ATCC 23117 / DSM 6794 / NBRC 15988 / NCIMB 1366 / Fx l1 / Sio-4) TaxID=880071 RepID=I4AQ66_BERLS|nr:gliding motility-associated ABC transporter substrate-binding protein GldG [Bernardetia litoralis]AFM06101.1 gliding-associated putative ABC transporter substrate-binding component GldG [Bernardetia litoralis DSM 6794]